MLCMVYLPTFGFGQMLVDIPYMEHMSNVFFPDDGI